MERGRIGGLLVTLVLCTGGCGPFAGPSEGPAGIHEGDYLAVKLEDGRVVEGSVSGWADGGWVEVHRTGDLVQRIDVDRVATFKVRCSHE